MGVDSGLPVEISENSHEVGQWWIQRTEFAINLANGTAYFGFQLLVLFDILSARNSNLNENNLPNPIRIVAEKLLESVELLDKTFDVVKPVNAKDDLDILVSLAQFLDSLLDLCLFERIFELLWIDSNHEFIRLDQPIFV